MSELIYSNFVFKLIISILLGAFLGIRREMTSINKQNHNFVGIRTLAILCCLGTTSTFFESLPYLPVILFTSVFILIAIAYTYGTFVLGRAGITTELSSALSFWIGVFVGYGEPVIAILITIFLATIETFKEKMHIFAEGLNEKEWIGALEFLTLSGAILPFLPRHPIDPWGILIPFSFWLIIMLISGLSFIGYFLTKYLGRNAGIMLTSFLGAIVSSTAVTISMAAKSKKNDKSWIFAIGIFIAIITMLFRIMIEILIVGNKYLDYEFFIAPVFMITASSIIITYLLKFNSGNKISKEKSSPDDLELQDPFEIKPALKFSLVFLIILFSIKFGKKYFGDMGVYAVSILSGIAEVDTLIISSLESLKNGELSAIATRNAITLAIITNTFVKMFYVLILGSRKLFINVFLGVFIITLSGILAFFA